MNISIALALNYKKEDIAPFLNSYEKHASGDLLLVTNNLNMLTNSKYSKIKLIDISEIIKKFNLNLQSLTVFNLKPIIFYLVLKHYQQTKSVKNALLTDVDILFQYDPFTLLDTIQTDTFLVCEEKKLYKDCDTNTTWFRAGYHEIYPEVENKKILNCGFTVGDAVAVIDYQKQVAHELQKILATRPYFAYDQVILNVLTYCTKTIQPTILQHGNPYIVHMHQMEQNELTNIFQNNQILNPQGQPYCVVHQYNEKEASNKFVQKNWNY